MPSPSIRPTVIGSFLSVTDSTALALLDPAGLTLGTFVFNQAVNAYFEYSLSDDALVPDDIVAVNGIDGVRWIKATAIEGAWLNGVVQYVSPNGSDDSDGLGWNTAKKTGYNAYAVIAAKGGGQMFLANGCAWGGPVDGQGMWLRADGLENSIPGWQRQVQCIIEGVGPSLASGLPTPFQAQGISTLFAGSNLASDFRHKPAIWLAYATNGPEIRNIQTVPVVGKSDGQLGNYQAFRVGWDYNRNTDHSLAYQAVTNSTRSGPAGNGSTVHTVALSAAVAIVSATRDTNGIVTCQVTADSRVAPPYAEGTKFWLASASGSFASGAYQVIGADAAPLAPNFWGFTFNDGVTSAPVGPIANPGSIRSVIANVNDLIELEAANPTEEAKFPSTVYPVTATSVTNASTGTITVRDVWGGFRTYPTTISNEPNVGNLIHQERGMFLTVATIMSRCTSRSVSDDAHPTRWGPMFDYGSCTAFVPELHRSYVEGYYGFGRGVPFEDRFMAAIYIQGSVAGTPALLAHNITGAQATFRFFNNGGFLGLLDIADVIFDSSDGQAPATYNVDGNNATSVSIYRTQTADVNAGTPYGKALNRIVGVPASNIIGDGSALGPWPSVAPASDTISSSTPDASVTTSPWTIPQIGTWGTDLQLSGRHPAAWRQISPSQRRLTEYSVALASTNPAPVATGILDPQGGTGAVRYDNTTGGETLIHSFGNLFTFGVGDSIIICGWVNAGTNDSYSASSNLVAVSSFAGTGVITWDNGLSSWSGPPPFYGTGWQFVAYRHKIASVTGNVHLQAKFLLSTAGGAQMDLFGVNMLWATAALTDNDIAQYVGTLRSAPWYLPPTMAGTFEGQKFVGHGGLGTAARYTVGVASGNITLTGVNTKAVELFDETGASLGVAVLQGFTVNP